MTLIGAFRLHFTSSTHFSLDASAFDHLNVSRIWSLRVCAVQRHDCFGVPTLQQRKIAVLRQIINSLNHRPGLLVIQGPPLKQPRGGFSHVHMMLQCTNEIIHCVRREIRPLTVEGRPVFEFQLHTHHFESIASISVRAQFSGLSLSSLHG